MNVHFYAEVIKGTDGNACAHFIISVSKDE
jgi:hypothetical protein